MTNTSLPPASSFLPGVSNTLGELPYEVKSTKFSPGMVAEIIIRVLRHCFSKMKEEYRWSEDIKKTKVVIKRASDTLETEGIEAIPRVIVSRNSYQIGQMGLNQSMSSAAPLHEAKGEKMSRHTHMITGGFSVIVEAQGEGTVELLADMVSTFLTWMSTHICVQYGLLNFGLPMSVGEPQQDKEATEKFKIVINSGYSTESHFKITEDSYKLLGVNLTTDVDVVPQS